MRWNETTHIFEQSLNDGASWAVLPLNASILNEGSINAARLPANIAVRDANNNFTAGQTITGSLNASGGFGFGASSSISAAATISLNIRNTAAGSANTSELSLGVDSQSRALILQSFASNFGSIGAFQANGSVIATQGAGGLSINTLDASPMRFWTANTIRFAIQATGEVNVNSVSNPIGSNLYVQGDQASRTYGLGILNSNAGNGLVYIVFLNSAVGGAGFISQTGANTVNYGTTSDERLKVNFGRFEDFTALRSLVIHDFKWRSDNTRDRGIFAQEAYEHYPKAISKGTDELTENGQLKMPWMTDYSKFVPDLIAGWQDHDGRLSEIKEKTRIELDGIQNELRALTVLYEELKNGGNSN
jgi:hypothetical protein